MSKSNDSYAWSRLKRTRYVMHRSASLVRLMISLAISGHRPKRRQATFNQLCDFMLEAGGVYTKFLQSVLLGVPEVREWIKLNDVDFFENVPVEPLNIGQILQQELGEGSSKLRLWPEVIASGTFAQVYAGLLDEDQPIVIKVQRLTIQPSLHYDVWLLKKFARYGRPFLTSLDADISSISKDFARLTLAEMDYKREAALGEELRMQLAEKQPEVIIPRTYQELCSSHVLIQERLGGISLAELIRSDKPLTQAQRHTLQDMVTTLLLLPFTTGLVHADPHPGNLRLIGERYAFLDFGALDDKYVDVTLYSLLLKAVVKAMDGTMTAAEALNAYFAAYAPRLYRALEITSRALGLPSVVDLFANYSMGTQATKPQSSFKGSLHALANINKLVNPGNRFALKSTPQNVSYTRTVHTLMQTMQLLNLKDEVIGALHAINEQLPVLTLTAQPPRETLSVVEAKEIVYSWLEKVIQRNPFMASELHRAFDMLKRDRSQQSSPESK